MVEPLSLRSSVSNDTTSLPLSYINVVRTNAPSSNGALYKVRVKRQDGRPIEYSIYSRGLEELRVTLMKHRIEGIIPISSPSNSLENVLSEEDVEALGDIFKFELYPRNPSEQ